MAATAQNLSGRITQLHEPLQLRQDDSPRNRSPRTDPFGSVTLLLVGEKEPFLQFRPFSTVLLRVLQQAQEVLLSVSRNPLSTNEQLRQIHPLPIVSSFLHFQDA